MIAYCANNTCWNESTDFVANIPLCEVHSQTVRAVAEMEVAKSKMIDGLVYYALFSQVNQVKIGSTTRPNHRFKELGKAYREKGPFRIVAAEIGGVARERDRHFQYHSWRVGRGEFFRYEGPLMSHVASITVSDPDWSKKAGIMAKYLQ